MSYLNLDLDFPDHPKTVRLVGLLGRGSETILIRLWSYCGKFHCGDGRLADYSEQEIEALAKWWGKSGAMLPALKKTRFMDRDSSGAWFMCNWKEHQGHIEALKVKGKAMAEARWGKIRDAVSIALSNTSSNPPSVPSPPTVLPEKERALSHPGETDEDPNNWPLKPPAVERSDRAPIPPERIKVIHEWYCNLTAPQALNMNLERSWYEFLKLFTEDEFKKVFSYLRGQVKTSKRNEGALKLSNLLQPDKFGEDLALARTNLHKPIVGAKPLPQANPPAPEAISKLVADMRKAAEA